jgi:hypothetical protein
MKRTLARIHIGLAWLLFIGSIIQFFLISLTVFGAADATVHANGGRILMLAALLLLIVALIIRTSKANVLVSLAVFLLLFPVQGMLAYSNIPGEARALHAVTGVLILGLSYVLANGFAKAVVLETEAPTEANLSEAASAAD